MPRSRAPVPGHLMIRARQMLEERHSYGSVQDMLSSHGFERSRRWIAKRVGPSKLADTTVRTPELVAKARLLRAEGYSYRSIAGQLKITEGVTVSWGRVRAWLVETPMTGSPPTVSPALKKAGIIQCSRCSNLVSMSVVTRRGGDPYCRPCLSIIESQDGTEERRIRATIKLQSEQAEQLKQDAFARLSQNTERALA